jgi:hypothetical protein
MLKMYIIPEQMFFFLVVSDQGGLITSWGQSSEGGSEFWI